MYLWLSMHLILVLSVFCFNQYITKYDLIPNQIMLPRSESIYFSNYKGKRPRRDFDIQIMFSSFSNSFHLLLNEDTSFNNSYESFSLKTRFYEGILKNVPGSLVIGYSFNGTFSGIINNGSELYFIEPAERFLQNYGNSRTTIVYRDRDISYPSNLKTTESDCYQRLFNGKISDVKKRKRLRSIVDLASKVTDEKKKVTKRKSFSCAIEMVADHTYYKLLGKSFDKVHAMLHMHGKFVDTIFKNTDFNGDGYPDDVRIVIKKVIIKKNIDDSDYPMAKSDDLLSYLYDFTSMLNNYCLSVSLCARSQENTVMGNAFLALPYLHQEPGGICQPPIIDPVSKTRRSYNKVVVTVVDKNRNALPMAISMLALTHELGHSFGSKHDELDNLRCSPGGKRGYHVMHPYTLKGTKSFNNKFSSCSRRDINEVLQNKGNRCTRETRATCGNGIREGNEECDCGTSSSCQFLDPCCTPSDAKAPNKGCTILKKPGYVCSHRENPCCSESCTAVTQTTKVCYQDSERCLVSHCDGIYPKCPTAVTAPDGMPCRGTSMVCIRGECNSTICEQRGLLDCKCTHRNLLKNCEVCCRKNNECITASRLGFYTPTGRVFYAAVGSPCSIRGHQCDGQGRCLNPFERNTMGTPMKTVKQSYFRARLRMLILPIVVLLICMLITCFVWRKSIMKCCGCN